MVERFSRFLDLKYGRITITSAKSRFGSCSSEGNLSFSYRCMLYPHEVQEYIVVHELCHLVHMNHSKEFYRLIASVLPDYKKRIQYLKLPIGTPYHWKEISHDAISPFPFRFNNYDENSINRYENNSNCFSVSSLSIFRHRPLQATRNKSKETRTNRVVSRFEEFQFPYIPHP